MTAKYIVDVNWIDEYDPLAQPQVGIAGLACDNTYWTDVKAMIFI